MPGACARDHLKPTDPPLKSEGEDLRGGDARGVLPGGPHGVSRRLKTAQVHAAVMPPPKGKVPPQLRPYLFKKRSGRRSNHPPRSSGGGRRGSYMAKSRKGKGGGYHAPKRVSVAKGALVAGAITLMSPRAAGMVAPIRAELEARTGLKGGDLVLVAVGNRVACSLVPQLGQKERAALATFGLRP